MDLGEQEPIGVDSGESDRTMPCDRIGVKVTLHEYTKNKVARQLQETSAVHEKTACGTNVRFP